MRKERLARLEPGVDVHEVGGSNEADMNWMEDRVLEGLDAKWMAMALFRSAATVPGAQPVTNDPKTGMETGRRALRTPLGAVSASAGVGSAAAEERVGDAQPEIADTSSTTRWWTRLNAAPSTPPLGRGREKGRGVYIGP